MSADLGLDPSDPLNLLLHNTSQRPESSMDDESTQDWSKFSTLWADHTDQSITMKPYSDIMDFSDLGSLAMDMDFDPSMTIEPSALHYDYMKLAQGMNYTHDDQFSPLNTELLSTQFPFTFQSALAAGNMSSASASPVSYKERRRSITSSSSSSGASLSPVPESIPSPQPGCASESVQPKAESSQANANANDPAAELAQRVRQSAGVMLAVPMGSQFQGYQVYQQMDLPTNTPQSKLPIPRLPRHNPASAPKSSSSSSAASTPPPSTPPASLKLSVKPNLTPADVSPSLTPTSAVPATAIPRPKTSHTTIERRYRTNLNARIQSLRMAVPALRVLEDKEGGNGKKIKKNVKGGVVVKGSGIGVIESEDGSVIDVIDERGFVDGVKVARKCSKANVLGKAVEYIRVLKKREHRLKAEQAGLKTLIGGLVGGAALVKEWEREWRTKFGGEEQDEVEGEDEEGDDEDSEDEEGEEGEEESGKKRKRPKISPAPKKFSLDKGTKKPVPSAVVLGNDQVPEKRKRGRPRKVLPTTVTVAPRATASPEQGNTSTMQDETMHPPTAFSTESQWVQQQQSQPQQFHLAVFALFSFFNSPLTSSSVGHDHHSHTGTVLNALHPPLAYAPDIISQFAAPPSSNMTPAWSLQDYVQMFHLFVSVMVLASFVGSWFGISFGSGRKRMVSVHGSLRSGDKALRRQGAIDWVKMGEQSVVEGKMPSLSLYERVQIYRSVSRKSVTSVGDLATLALVARATTGVLSRLGRMKARSTWAAARDLASGTHPKPPTLRIYEKLVFETLSVDEAFNRLALASASGTLTKDEDGRIYTPLEVLGCLIVKERVKKHVGKLFVQVVAHAGKRTMVNDEEEREEEEARRMTVDAARELGGSVEMLGKGFEQVWKTASVEDDDLSYLVDSESMESVVDDEIKALFTALVLYRRFFVCLAHPECLLSSTLRSLPSSPTPKMSAKRARMLLELRQALGNKVFEDTDVEVEQEEPEDMDSLEDARDQVVDMIVDAERRERGVSSDSSSSNF
ncbi:hypothetical protein BYT27DRAFT_7106313 [Phlegmacium glaucopus]|nr:hypothetical protein BYT27DRAFT_7106313 [Phlegmacium glaucopus]